AQPTRATRREGQRNRTARAFGARTIAVPRRSSGGRKRRAGLALSRAVTGGSRRDRTSGPALRTLGRPAWRDGNGGHTSHKAPAATATSDDVQGNETARCR